MTMFFFRHSLNLFGRIERFTHKKRGNINEMRCTFEEPKQWPFLEMSEVEDNRKL